MVLDAGLCYVTDCDPGWTRTCGPDGFVYVGENGRTLKDPNELDRIRKLAIPPAYQNVWICSDPNGHLQATGIDARGRKQYRYHPRFREIRDEDKFHRMADFGKALSVVRKQVDADLARRGLPKERLLAVVLSLLERSLIRVGNDEYAKQNKSYGLTTMLSRHVTVRGQQIRFTFRGKSKKDHQIEVRDLRVARLVKRIQDLPGQELFHYQDESGQARCVSSSDVNQYLREITGQHFTSKDFRTWWGTLLAFIELSLLERPTSQTAIERSIGDVIKKVSQQLGNTPSICRKCYVHPAVLEAFRAGSLKKSRVALTKSGTELVTQFEKRLLKLLRSHQSS